MNVIAKHMKILVTGGAGFIGSHTIVTLCEAGHEAIVLDDFRNSDPSVLDGIREITNKAIPAYRLDASRRKSYDAVMQSEGRIGGVIHFAALKAVGDSVANPLAYYRNNIASLLCALEFMRENGIRNIIFSSSATVYGEADTSPVTEETPRKPASSPYGNTKQICEDILKDSVLSMSFPLKAVALRYFNPIGAHPSGRIGELPIGTPANLVPFLVQAASGKRGPLTIFGNDYPTPDGTGVRDYIHVMDLAEAHVTALEYLLKSSESNMYDVFNVGTGKPTSVKELIASFEKTTGVAVPHAYGPRRPGDVARSWADVSKIRENLGWESKRSVAQALEDAWRWENRRD